MRPLLVPITGITDAAGAATLNLQLPRSDEWHNAKITLGSTGPAEWAVNLGGTPVNYGRGRRVTLGPELIQPMDQVQVGVTNGPLNAAIVGSLTGVSGSQEEIVPNFIPAPNTIAVDILKLPYDWQNIASGAAADATFTITPPGTRRVQIEWVGINIASAGGAVATSEASATGALSGKIYSKFVSNQGLAAFGVAIFDSSADLAIIGKPGDPITFLIPGLAGYQNTRLSAGGYFS